MEIQKRAAESGNNFWNIVRIVFHMMKKTSCKKNTILEPIHILLKRGKIAGKSIANLLLHHHHHYSALSCRPDDINASFVSPREYEFSCSNTPIYPSKYKNHHYQTEELKVMRRVFKILQASPPPEISRSPVAAEQHQHQVDKDAEEFIKKFYKDLKKQRRISAALGSP